MREVVTGHESEEQNSMDKVIELRRP